MKTGNYNEKCPHCETKIDYYDHFAAHAYDHPFDMECPSCEKEIHVVVHIVPEFENFKKGEEG